MSNHQADKLVEINKIVVLCGICRDGCSPRLVTVFTLNGKPILTHSLPSDWSVSVDKDRVVLCPKCTQQRKEQEQCRFV